MTDSPKVFVVDDESVIASTLAVILKQSGFDAEAFTDPLEALTASRVRPPEMLISDVMMPGMTGVELAIQMRSMQPNCRILLFSGQAATADLLAKARLGGHDFRLLQKPVHPKDLLTALRAL